MTTIGRFDTLRVVSTPLNPLEDLTSWVQNLNSEGYTADLIREVHKITDKRQVDRAATAIAAFATSAVSLIEQGYSGTPEVSFLPLYYSLLDLSKIYIGLAGRLGDLEKNRWHGVTYNPSGKKSHGLLTEQVILARAGVMPLFFEVLTNTAWCHSDRRLQLGEIYPYLTGVGHEYSHFYGAAPPIQLLRFHLHGSSAEGFWLSVIPEPSDHPNANKLRYLQVLRGFRRDGQNIFRSPTTKALTREEALEQLKAKHLWRWLFYGLRFEEHYIGHPGVLATLNASRVLLPEEIPIWLAFYHLSNIVRYNPEFLRRLKDSRAWGLLLALRKHTVLRFLLLFWSHLHKTEFVVRSV